VIPIGCSPNGRNINDGCGSMDPELLQLTVPAVRANAGVALDGDGDRLVMVDETGTPIDGDQLLYILATARQQQGTLKGPVVGTVMSNLGLEHALKAQDIDFRRAAVGDRYVLETLKESGGVIGGETSGHMIVLDQTTTGDGIITALQVLAVMKQTGKTLSELVSGMPKYPQTMINVRTGSQADPGSSPKIREAVAAAESELADTGRIVLRASGTEPVIRIMVEAMDREKAAQIVDDLVAVVGEELS